ncbi:MAG: PID-CTERM protein-sorting domain-containing protein [Bacteroidales bacterium]
MKKFIYLTMITFLLILSIAVMADGPPPPPPDSGSGGTPVGAPIDGGLGILLAMGAAYGGKKLYKARKDRKKEEEFHRLPAILEY